MKESVKSKESSKIDDQSSRHAMYFPVTVNLTLKGIKMPSDENMKCIYLIPDLNDESTKKAIDFVQGKELFVIHGMMEKFNMKNIDMKSFLNLDKMNIADITTNGTGKGFIINRGDGPDYSNRLHNDVGLIVAKYDYDISEKVITAKNNYIPYSMIDLLRLFKLHKDIRLSLKVTFGMCAFTKDLHTVFVSAKIKSIVIASVMSDLERMMASDRKKQKKKHNTSKTVIQKNPSRAETIANNILNTLYYDSDSD